MNCKLVSLQFVVTLCSLLYSVNGDCGPRDSGAEIVEIFSWMGSGSWNGLFEKNGKYFPKYLGHEIDKSEWNCPVDCRFTSDKDRLANVDGFLFEAQPVTDFADRYKREAPQFPQKYVGQHWITTGYEQQYYFDLYGDPGYIDYVDTNFTYYLHSQVPITFTCLWGGGNFSDFLKPPIPKDKDKCVLFITTNCNGGGAGQRTAYAAELMEHMDVHSYGKCLHNKDFPPEMQFPIYQDHGASMRNKIFIFKNYKFVLVFENNNVTDYVTEKMQNVLQAGSVPVYMGSENVDPYWIPGENSIVKVSDFKGPKDLAQYLTRMCNDEDEYAKFFEWKKKGASQHFIDRFNNCAYYGGECRLCQHILKERNKLPPEMRKKVDERRGSRHQYFSLRLDGSTDLRVDPIENIDLTDAFTFSTWLKVDQDLDKVIFERENLYRVRLVPHNNKKQAFVELCLFGELECYTSSFAINPFNWQHFVVVYKFEQDQTGYVRFWINGMPDSATYIPTVHITQQDYSKDRHKNTPLYIASNSQKTVKYKGLMDDISIWKKDIDAKKGKSLIYDVLAGHEEGLSLFWSFNKGNSKDLMMEVELQASGGEVKYEQSETKPLITTNPWY